MTLPGVFHFFVLNLHVLPTPREISTTSLTIPILGDEVGQCGQNKLECFFFDASNRIFPLRLFLQITGAKRKLFGTRQIHLGLHI